MWLVVSLKLFLTSLDLLAILRELKSILISTRIENIYNLDAWGFIFRLHGAAGNFDLIVELGKRLNITNFKYPIPPRPSQHAIKMRSLILNAAIRSIDQIDLDRIVYLTLEKAGSLLQVYFELFGDGNIIITNGSGRILYAFRQKTMRDRTIRIGAAYKPSPSRGESICKDPNIDEIRSQGVEIVRSLTRYYNLPPEFVEEILKRSSIDTNLPSSEIDEKVLGTFLNNARDVLKRIESMPLRPNIALKERERISVQPIEFISLPHERLYFESFNSAVDEYFAPLFGQRETEKEKHPKEEEIKELEAVLARQRSSLKELEEKRDRDREIGELIISNLSDVQKLIGHVVNKRKSGVEWEEIKRSAPMKILDIDRSKGLLTATIGNKEVVIDFKHSATENAERYFSSSKDCSRKLIGLINAIKETEEKIQDLKQGLLEVKPPVVLKSIKKEWYERFRWTFSSQDFLIVGGKDARQNEILVKKHMEPKDIFVHSDVPGGSVVLIKSKGEEVPQETKEEAVSFAVAYSKAWKAGLGAADGYWVRAEQVTKTPPAGEYLGKGAFMIYGERNYIRNVPLSIFLGIQIIGGAFKIVVGSENFVRNASVAYVKLVPGSLIGSALTRKIKMMLVQRAGSPLSQLINAVPESEILAHIPSGGSMPI